MRAGMVIVTGALLGYGWVGWKKHDLYAFADIVVKGGEPYPTLGRPELDVATGRVRAETTGIIAAYNVNAKDARGLLVSSQLVQVKVKAPTGESTGSETAKTGNERRGRITL